MVSVGRRYATVHAGTTASQQLAAIASPNGSTVRRGLANIAPGRRNDVLDSTHHTPIPAIARTDRPRQLRSDPPTR